MVVFLRKLNRLVFILYDRRDIQEESAVFGVQPAAEVVSFLREELLVLLPVVCQVFDADMLAVFEYFLAFLLDTDGPSFLGLCSSSRVVREAAFAGGRAENFADVFQIGDTDCRRAGGLVGGRLVALVG